MPKTIIPGFSKLAKAEKIRELEKQLDIPELSTELQSYWHTQKQTVFDEFSENVISNFYLPYSVAPNFLINHEVFHVPMVTEESSVVAAASSAAGFWAKNGGIKARVVSTKKTGQVHFLWKGDHDWLKYHFTELSDYLHSEIKPITQKMEERGGGVTLIKLLNKTSQIPDYFQLFVEFETVDSMGANFINSVLEQMASSLSIYSVTHFPDTETCEVIMSILSNYTPDCIVEASVEAPVEALGNLNGKLSGEEFVRRFVMALQIAHIDAYRAVTHNKGIMNGVDAVLLATGNDFRAIEAGVHAYAFKRGKYTSLSIASIDNGIFRFSVTLPLALGSIGGLTQLHPLAKKSLEILGNPDAKQLMIIAASVGLANHFSASKALITSGIQKGHMKMHLTNILTQLGATDNKKKLAIEWFADKTVSVSAVRDFIQIKHKPL